MDLKKVKELIELMIDKDLVEIELKDGDKKISLKRPQAPPVITHVPMTHAAAPAPAETAVAESASQAEESDLVEIKSPMVGTFYSAPSPDADPFVSIGTRVGPETVVCIIEAMKVMNEIKSEVSGTITEILSAPGKALEFGEAIFKVKPD
ncbi:MAG: acetyl-CoA carboxylase biotin carboxyl carrier protein [Planctomycetes bacterium]|nr:acetyl-CoA carboxylase biotin carboxyl carrier protein [Planctomycetota bacterium]